MKFLSERHRSILRNGRLRAFLSLRQECYGSKVFCIGFNKTGTTSCGYALQMLGYRHTTFNRRVWREYYKNNEIEKILAYTAKFDSTDDLPWLKEDMIPILDTTFPGSKFIYLERDETSWQRSLYHWTYKKTGVYPELKLKLAEFRRHRRFVQAYFKNRPSCFLALDVRRRGAFKKMGDFLGHVAPEINMPHANKAR